MHHSSSVGGASFTAAVSRSAEYGSGNGLGSAATAAAAALATRLPPLLVTPGAAAALASSTSRVSRATSDDVELAAHDQESSAAAPSGSGAAAGDGGSGSRSTAAAAGGSGAPSKQLPQRQQAGTAAADEAASQEATTAAAAAEASAAAGSSAPAATGNRVELSVSVIGAAPPAAAAAAASAATAETEAGAVVGMPVLLLPPLSAQGTSSHITVVGRPAAAVGVPGGPAPATTAGSGSDGGVRRPEPGVDGVDAVANIAIAGTATAGGAARRRRRHGSTGGGASGDGDGDESGVDEEGSAGPCALPAEVRRRLRLSLGRQRMRRVRTWKDLAYSMASTRPGYWLVGTMALLAALLGCFLFMAGQYEFLRGVDLAAVTAGARATAAATPGASSATTTSALASPSPSASLPDGACWGPACLRGWLAFWRPRAARTFSFDYLRAWGGRYGPDLAAGEWWRWLSSIALHASPLHLASNLALLLVLSSYLESLYGFWRVLPVWLVAGVAGNMASAFFEAPCTLVVGSSGAVFGLLGAYAADAVINWESLPLLWLRLAGMAGLGGFMLALQLTNHGGGSSGGGSVSNASHAGGFVVGLLAALLVTPDFKARRAVKVKHLLSGLGLESSLPDQNSPAGRQVFSFWQRHRFLLYGLYGTSVAVLLMALLAVPLQLYLHTFKDLECS
ncbi:hypothetical protein GPECTOR_63g26 [Gonium pectorale]|uniref:RHOMBOID-like protein n=1 Tax=Gonium pectorale TaxID=33097 RepID=A0A150G4E7_GONPE|nr:hypothetical protein GPECTOR_63g26 [Gonium pectorale]|eukprot:KXZ44698.1 hypothetical protein GPECTOR_63g26 [Gonium pectorale]